ncbi:Protein CBG17990 [Caenorhabditis briggsae]|uniref:Maelstrom domain-containing protein n=2 Tax=Caenorhabditis briggsae TaxID=6238 RepID=A0AAE9DBP9_CAEBR|nr:Protein CBG17990 [Caenorhabditis briggsae]ULU00805.1 hypothetical protein L3Y34_001314 [Caenorhabditis briggsae]CAP35519.1 Protein CBG17990 [Caenorhabditis briggsae]
MRKQNRPNQTTRKQMQNLTVELFSRDKNARRQLLDEALSVSPPSVPEPVAVVVPETPPPVPTPEPIQELVQVLLAPEPCDPIPRKPRSPRKSISTRPKPKVSDGKLKGKPEAPKEKPATENVVNEEPTATPEPEPNSVTSEETIDSAPQRISAEEIVDNNEYAEKEVPAVSETVVQEEPPVSVPEDPVPTTVTPVEEEYVTPPPLQRIPYSAQQSNLANIRAVAESMNIAAIRSPPHQQSYQPQEPMSFAACVRKQPSIESMSVSPSPYCKFDGKTSPFNTGANGGFSNPGGFGGFNRDPNKNVNPFANRKKFNYEYDSAPSNNSHSPFNNNRFYNDRAEQMRDVSDSFSSLNSKPNGFMTRGIPRESASSGMLPNWYKGRSFSTASSHYPYSQRSNSSGHFSGFSKPSHSTTLNIPSHGHVEDLDGFLASGTQSNPFLSKRSDLNLKKERWARMKAKKRMLRRPIEDEFYEDPDEEEEILRGNGVMLNQIVQQSSTGHYEDADLLRKYRRDVAFVKERVLSAIDGNIDGIRDLRFLLASVQTYGNIDGECMMAELGLNEFSLFSGIIEKYHAIVGPWQTDNESQRRRASRHAFETHRIPLQHSIATVSKRKLVEEILGRVEPSIACHQGVKVGLYSDSCNEKTRIELNIKNNFKDPGMLCDKNDRRFILVLQSELDLMVESMKHLAKTVGFNYDGFPVHQNNFVIVEAFVEAISDIMGEKVDMETMRWFSLLGQKVDAEESASPWEPGTDFHCSRHSEPKSNFCAAVTVGRTCCIIYHVLGSFFRRYHLKKIPTAHQNSSSFNSMQ